MWRFLTKSISTALSFSKVEARGTLVLTLIIFLCISISQIYISQLKKDPGMASDQDAAALQKWVAELEASVQLRKAKPRFSEDNKKIQRKSIKQETKPKPSVESSSISQGIAASNPTPDFLEVLDLNTASAEDLQRVRGIGAAYSNRIIKFREKLGGFAKAEQLNEVYGLPPETVEELMNYYEIQSRPQPINFNADSAKHLARHPYISYDLAWTIINYRKQHGDIRTIDDLRKIKAIDQQTLERLELYLF